MGLSLSGLSADLFDLSSVFTFLVFHTFATFVTFSTLFYFPLVFYTFHTFVVFHTSIHNNSKHFSSRRKEKAGCKMSRRGTLSALSILTAAITSLVEHSLHKSWSADGEIVSIFRWEPAFLVNSWNSRLNIPFFIRHKMTTLGFIRCGIGEIIILPVRLLIVAQALWLECFMSMFSTVFVHAALRLLMRCSNSLFAALTYQEEASQDCF